MYNVESTWIKYSAHQLFRKGYIYSTEAEFLDENKTKILRVFNFVIHSHLYSFALRFLFLQTHATSYYLYSTVKLLWRRKEEDLIENPIPYVLRNPYRNLKSENSQDYAYMNLTEWIQLLYSNIFVQGWWQATTNRCGGCLRWQYGRGRILCPWLAVFSTGKCHFL